MGTRAGSRRPFGPPHRHRPRGGTNRRPDNSIRTPLSATKVDRRAVEIPGAVSVKELAEILGLSPAAVIKELIGKGVLATVNQTIDRGTATIISQQLGFEVQEPVAPEEVSAEEDGRGWEARPQDEGKLLPRPPVVTIMGHVDHGKTSLLDAIRQTNVTAQEVGGITQHIGAYQVEVKGEKITFLDTPGHEAFTAMRARGAQVTDIAVLVVAADDGVMPQTLEAIDHAKAARVPIVVAINKIDKGDANPDRIKQQLTDAGILVEEWGGDVPAIGVSARRKTGIEDLLANILVVAEVAELRANPQGPANGVVVEAKLDKTRGPLATVLVQRGTLEVGDSVVVGAVQGKVRAMFNDKGKRLKKAGPAMPVEILGLVEVPAAGDLLAVVKDDKEARAISMERARQKQADVSAPSGAVSLDEVFSQIQAGKIQELNIILKTDVQGSIEPIRNSLERLSDEKIKVKVIHQGTGSITESDVLLAQASNAIIIGFNSRPEPGAKRAAEAANIDIRFFNIIYEVVAAIEKALLGMLEPTYVDALHGHAEVRQIFKVGRSEIIAGCMVLDGKAIRGDLARIKRGGEVIAERRIVSLRRFKEDVKEVATGYECGIALDDAGQLQQGDIIEAYAKERTT
ncbi:MAG: translation initiation factor IF-2 [Chloroflexi bacterium]|nr:translation initiation factor IF-2 [Chloroflexota bacterium]